MSQNLFPVFDVPSETVESTPISVPRPQYRPAPLWDYEKGDFVMNGARQPIYGNGNDAWVFWCMKTIRTQRWSKLAYSGNIGIEKEEAFRESDRKAQESALERTITEALLADPMGRARQVRDFKFDWRADSLWISCVVYGAEGNSEIIRADLK